MKSPTLDAALALTILEAAPAIVLALDAAGCLIYVNGAFETLTGLHQDDVRGQEWCSTCLPHRDRARVRAWIAATRAGDEVAPLVSPVYARAGERTVEWQARQIRDDRTGECGVVCVGRDVTTAVDSETASVRHPLVAPESERTSVDRALVASESRLLRAQRVGRIGSWELDLRTSDLEWSDELYRIVELHPAQVKPSRAAFTAIVHPEDRAHVAHASALAIEGRLPECMTHRLLMPNGRIKWVENRWELEYDEAGEVARIVGTLQDVTTRVEAESALGKTQHAYRQLDAIARMRARAIDASLNAIAFADLSGRLTYVNAAFVKLWRLHSDDDAVGEPYETFWPDAVESNAAFDALLRTGTWSGALRTRRHDGSEFHLLLSATVICDDNGQPSQLMASMVDVTERRNAEEEVRRSRDLLRAVIDSSPDFIFAKDDRHRFLFVNRAFAQRRGSTSEMMLGRLDGDFFPDDLSEGGRDNVNVREDDLLVLGGQTVRQLLETGSREAGTWRAFDSIKRPLKDEEGRAYGVLVYSRDTTEQYLAHEAQARALAEKETLLREIHHRVKNNLQVISSLLHFQAKKASTPEDRAVFEDGRKRLLAMILVHEKLYQSRELSGIEFGLYARSLSAALVASFEDRGRVRLEFSAADVRLPVDVALPLGLILCELITNVFKYAFPGDRPGVAQVSVVRSGGQFVLAVDDNGVGMPPEFDPRQARTFGWHLIMMLIGQLGASLEIARDCGTRVSLALPLMPDSVSAAVAEPAVHRP